MAKTRLIIAGFCVIVIGLLLLYVSHVISVVDNSSVAYLLSEDRVSQEILSGFRFTPWGSPDETISPFVSAERSFKDCEIMRYRQGTKTHWLARCTYYEAEYRRRDGSTVVGPAVGPRSYTSPNLIWPVIVIALGLGLLIGGLQVNCGQRHARTGGEKKRLAATPDPDHNRAG